jgi:hypothetical protein
MQSADPIILQEYARIRSCFDFDLLGLLDIGSHTRGEAVTMSDRCVLCALGGKVPSDKVFASIFDF